MNDTFYINEDVLKRPIVIYGAGALGMDCMIELLNRDAYVTCFCDSSPEKQKIRVLNKRVISRKGLLEMKESHNVIIAVSAFREIGELLEQQGMQHVYYYKDMTRK